MRRIVAEYGLLLCGLCFVGFSSASYLKYSLFQAQKLPVSSVHQAIVHPVSVESPIGRVSIPRIGLSVLMVEGDGETSLQLGAGHMPGTALAGDPGNMVIAGHRDSAFWPLRNIHKGDEVEVIGPSKAVYRVESTEVVDPANVALLRNTKDAVLTMVTCYPFRHVGPAPQRFVVRATLIH